MFSFTFDVKAMLPAVIEPPKSVNALTVCFRSAVENRPCPAKVADAATPMPSAYVCECDVAVKFTAFAPAATVVERPR